MILKALSLYNNTVIYNFLFSIKKLKTLLDDLIQFQTRYGIFSDFDLF